MMMLKNRLFPPDFAGWCKRKHTFYWRLIYFRAKKGNSERRAVMMVPEKLCFSCTRVKLKKGSKEFKELLISFEWSSMSEILL